MEALAIIEDSIPNIGKIKVVRVCIGWGYTGVKLSTGHVGICHSLLEEQALRCCQIVKRAGNIAGSSAIDLANLAKPFINVLRRRRGVYTFLKGAHASLMSAR
jgi:hypothetical protein